MFRAQLDGGALFVERDALTFSFYDKKKFRAIHHGGLVNGRYRDAEIKGHAYRINFENSNITPAVEKLQRGTDYENFYIGNDEQKWKSNVQNYHQLWLRNIYAGIDYELLTAVNGLKYNFHLKAGADPKLIRMRYEGVDKMSLRDGALILKLAVNEVIEQRPYAYQIINGKTRTVPCSYRKSKIHNTA